MPSFIKKMFNYEEPSNVQEGGKLNNISKKYIFRK